MTRDVESITSRWDLVTGDWSIEPHGDGEVLYSGRSGHRHGLNIVYLNDPSYQWPAFREAISHAYDDVAFLLAEVARLQALREPRTVVNSEVVSPAGSAIRVIRYDVTPEARQGLSIGENDDES